MPSHAATAARSARHRAGSGTSIRWDRVLRWVLRGGVAVLVLLTLKAAVGIAVTALERSDRAAELQQLKTENASLQARRKALQGDGGVEIEARRLGMVKPGEVPIVVTGLPGNPR